MYILYSLQFCRHLASWPTAREYGAGVRAQFFNSHRSAGLQAGLHSVWDPFILGVYLRMKIEAEIGTARVARI